MEQHSPSDLFVGESESASYMFEEANSIVMRQKRNNTFVISFQIYVIFNQMHRVGENVNEAVHCLFLHNQGRQYRMKAFVDVMIEIP